MFLFLALACVHRPVIDVPADASPPTVSAMPPDYVPEYEPCKTDFPINLQGVSLGDPISGWINGELVYKVQLAGNLRFVSCLADFNCVDPKSIHPFENDLPPGCITQSHCCDLGAVNVEEK